MVAQPDGLTTDSGKLETRYRSRMQLKHELALVTGASSGIGAEFARRLAAEQAHLILTARRRDRLEALAAELTEKHAIQVAVIEADLSAADGPHQLLDRLATAGHEPSILINNAGFGVYGPFLDQSAEDIDAMLQVDIRALTQLSRRLAEPMVRRGRGAILNVASFAALAPIPRYAVYSAAKAYVVAFSQALRHELAPQGVSVSVICPGFTNTEFFDVSGHAKTPLMRATELTAAQVAAAGISGLKRGTFLIVPGWWYKLNTFTSAFAPRTVLTAISGALVKQR